MSDQNGTSEETPTGVQEEKSTHGMDTTFFMSRGRHLMTAPMNELLAICERLIVQSRALGQEKLVPDFQKIAQAAQHLMSEFTEISSAPTLKLGSVLENLVSKPDPAATPKAKPSTNNSPTARTPSILLVDDNPLDSELVSLLLEQKGYQTSQAVDGKEALRLLREQSFDLVLLDIILPELNGYQVLKTINADEDLSQIPVIIISGMGGMDSVVRCIELGADDYLPKPLNPVLLRARIEASLERKRLRDQEAAYLQQLQTERQKSELLLLNILPEAISQRLKQGESTIVENYADVTVLFADIVGFSQLASKLTPRELVATLNEIFSELDYLADRHGLEKIKTIGDAYLAVGGLPNPLKNHTAAVANMALDVQKQIVLYNQSHGTQLKMRIGIHVGPVVAGIIGKGKFNYDLWGDTVNLASRMESQGQPDTIQVTAPTYHRLQKDYDFEQRDAVEIKGKGTMTTYLLQGKKSPKTTS